MGGMIVGIGRALAAEEQQYALWKRRSSPSAHRILLMGFGQVTMASAHKRPVMPRAFCLVCAALRETPSPSNSCSSET